MCKCIVKELYLEVGSWFRTVWPSPDSHWELKEDSDQVGYWLEKVTDKDEV